MSRSRFLLLPASVLFGVVAAAQTPACQAWNDASTVLTGNLSAFSFAGQNTRAYQVAPTAAATVLGVRFYTGNSALTGNRFFSVQVWSDAGGLPGTLLASGTWKLLGPGLSWIGADLDHAVAMAANAPYWIAYFDPGFSDLPEGPAGITVATAVRNGTTWSLAGSAQPKIRLYCGLLDDAGVVPFGPSCAGSTGASPTAYTNQAPTIGNNLFAIEGSGFLTGGVTVMAIGYTPGYPSVPLPGLLPPGCAVNTDFVDVQFGTAGTGASAGHAFFPVPVPNNPAFLGAYGAVQLGGVDAALAVPLPLVTTNAVQLTVY